jgi:hypothetical protein
MRYHYENPEIEPPSEDERFWLSKLEDGGKRILVTV